MRTSFTFHFRFSDLSCLFSSLFPVYFNKVFGVSSLQASAKIYPHTKYLSSNLLRLLQELHQLRCSKNRALLDLSTDIKTHSYESHFRCHLLFTSHFLPFRRRPLLTNAIINVIIWLINAFTSTRDTLKTDVNWWVEDHGSTLQTLSAISRLRVTRPLPIHPQPKDPPLPHFPPGMFVRDGGGWKALSTCMIRRDRNVGLWQASNGPYG